MRPSSLLRDVVYSAITLLSVAPLMSHAADGTFWTYFQRMMWTWTCPVGSVLQPFTNTADSSYASRNCVSLSTLLWNTAWFTAPAWQAVIGFTNTGALRFAALWDEAPIGSIMAFDLAICPAWWLPADGVAATPDLRGEFIRGWHSGMTGRQVSPTNTTVSSAVGSWQEDMFRSHSHTTDNFNPSGWWRNSDGFTRWMSGMGGTITSNATWWSETRPRNIALLYCKKVASSAPTTNPNLTWTNTLGTSNGHVTLATTGNVGIGTPAPSARLDVIGNIRSSSGILANQIAIGNTSNTHGPQSYPHQTIQLPGWANLRFNFGWEDRAILTPTGVLEVRGWIRFPDNTLQTTARGGWTLNYQTTTSYIAWGGWGGWVFQRDCPPWYVVTWIIWRAGRMVDQIGVRCTKLD